MNGVSMYRAMAAATPTAGLPLSVDENSRAASDATGHVRFDVCSTWLDLAIRHLSDAQVAQVARIAAWEGTDENLKAGALEWEFEASMQAVMAASIALDAFCAAVQTKVQPPPSLTDAWREKRNPHYVENAEILRVAFSLTAKEANSLRQNLGEIFRFRDLAVDSSSKSGAPILHPELRVGGEWRFAYFRCENARLVVGATLRVVGGLVASERLKDAGVQQYIDVLRSRLERLQASNALRADAPATMAHRPPIA